LNAIPEFYRVALPKQGGELKNVLILGKGTLNYRSKNLEGRHEFSNLYTPRETALNTTQAHTDDYFALLNGKKRVSEEEVEKAMSI